MFSSNSDGGGRRPSLMQAAIALLLVNVLYTLLFGPVPQAPTIRTVTWTEFLKLADAGAVKEAYIDGRKLLGGGEGKETVLTWTPPNTDVSKDLTERGVDIGAAPPQGPGMFAYLMAWLPMIVILGVWWWMSRGGIGGIGKSPAKTFVATQSKVTFADVAGVDEAKADLAEIVDFLRNPSKYSSLGGRMPSGVLLVGPPGTGKTLTARAVAGEAGVPFLSLSGSDFVEMFVGVGASRVRSVFAEARKKAPCIIFIDEIDSIGRKRGGVIGNDEREQTLNAMLVEMDGFEPNSGLIIIAATNRVDVLDPALLRPGRFDRHVEVPLPDLSGRQRILEVHARGIALSTAVDLHKVARGTAGFSGADLANLLNEAALSAARRGGASVEEHDVEHSRDKVMMGAERRTLTMSPEEVRLTAVHEAGHAVCAVSEEASDRIHRATIVPRGGALGMVVRLPERDRVSISLEKLEADLTVAMGGRAAEALVFGDRKITTGASSDIRVATDMARRMVTEWGMSPLVGMVHVPNGSDGAFHASREHSREVESEVRRIVDAAYARATSILTDRRKALDAVSAALVARETLTGDEVDDIIAAAA